MCCKLRSFVIALSAGLLVSCGGGGGGGSSSDAPVVVTDDSHTIITIPVDDGMQNPVSTTFDGSTASVTAFYSQAQIDAIEGLGLVFHVGDQPPNMEGTFVSSPHVMQNTNVPGDQDTIGNLFNDTRIELTNQNNSDLTIDMVLTQTPADGSESTVSVGNNAFISGTGPFFTIYFIAETTELDTGLVTRATITLSGSVTDNGLENLQTAYFLLDDAGDPNNNIIPNNTGRLFIDEDGLAERVFPAAPDSVYSPLFGNAVFEIMFDGGDQVFEDTVPFSVNSLTTNSNGVELLSEESLVVGVDYTCAFIESTGRFLCLYTFESGSQTTLLFGFDEPGRATGVFDFCIVDGTESCDNESVVDRLFNNPDGDVTVTVNPAPIASRLAATPISDEFVFNAQLNQAHHSLVPVNPTVTARSTEGDVYVPYLELLKND